MIGELQFIQTTMPDRVMDCNVVVPYKLLHETEIVSPRTCELMDRIKGSSKH